MRKAFKFIKPEDVVTRVYDKVSATIPDQALSLRELMLRFSYLGEDRMQDVVNRGFDGDEDEDLLGFDVSSLDYAEVHDRILELKAKDRNARSLHVEPVAEPEEVTPEPEPESEGNGDSR